MLTYLPLPNLNQSKLPNNSEATMDIPYHKLPKLKKAHGGLQQPLARFLESKILN